MLCISACLSQIDYASLSENIDLLFTDPTGNKTGPNELIIRQLITPTASIKSDKSPPFMIPCYPPCMAVYNGFGITYIYLTWLLGWLDRGALINVDDPGRCTSVVQGPTGHKY